MSYTFTENIQRGILFFVKNNLDFYKEAAPLIKSTYFEFPTHDILYRGIVSYFEQYKKLPNDEFLLEYCKQYMSTKDSIADFQDEIELINTIDTKYIDNQDFYLDQVEKFAKLESMKDAIASSIDLIRDGNIEAVEEVIRKALTVSRNQNLGQLYYDDITDRWVRTLSADHLGDKFKTILPTLDRHIDGGLRRKELAMVIAPPGVGKSLFLVNQSVSSLMENRKILYVSLEMSEDRIAQRFDSIVTLIHQGSLAHKQELLGTRLSIFHKKFGNSELIIKEFPTGIATINNIRALLNQLRNYHAFVPDLLVVDYLELLRCTRDGMAEYQAQQRIAEELRGLAVENNFLVWTATQTNRLGRNVELIDDSHLADAYGKIRVCDYSISLNQNVEEHDEGRMRCYVVKSRNGANRIVVPMEVNYNTLRMSEAVENGNQAEE